jgi:DNA topoisomerase-1
VQAHAKASSPSEVAGLRHVHDGQRGFRRLATGRRKRGGKRWVVEFAIRDDRNRRVRAAATLPRIRALAIPPPCQWVWVCGDPRGHLQATGRDARGRKQYRYHPRWREERDGTKYDRMVEFAQALPRLRRTVAADLRRPGLPREKVLAAIVRLLETTFMRVGNDEYARTNHSFGLTTLRDRHVDFGAGELHLHFRGKSGVFHRVHVHDPRLARVVRRCRDLPGQDLFQYLDADGQPHTVGSADVNAYIRTAAGHAFTAKDFRTWAGTVLAAQALGGAREARLKKAPARSPPGPPTNSEVREAIAEVAARLGNTVAVCRKCYVHPHVIAAFLDGELQPRSLHTVGTARAAHHVVGGLRAEEAAVLRLLLRYRKTDSSAHQAA